MAMTVITAPNGCQYLVQPVLPSVGMPMPQVFPGQAQACALSQMLGRSGSLVSSAPASAPGNARARPSPQAPLGAAGPALVTGAVQSLYADALKPYGRILRKRILDQAQATGRKNVDFSIGELRAMCEACPWLQVQDVKGADWAALLIGVPETFVDVYSPVDVYPARLWREATEYFGQLDREVTLPGGRFACAELLLQQRPRFLSGLSLGEACHVVQLAITQKKLLGYSSGLLVPYARSQSMLKDKSAERQRPCPGSIRGASSVVTWETFEDCMRHLFGKMASCGENSLPISNLKRLFRSEFSTELSETALGHAKLSELLQDSRLNGLCSVELLGHGYVVKPRAPAAREHKKRAVAVVPVAACDDKSRAAAELRAEAGAGTHGGSSLRKRAGFLPSLCMEEILSCDVAPARPSKSGGLCSPSPTVRNDLLAVPKLPTLLGSVPRASPVASQAKTTGGKSGAPASSPVGAPGTPSGPPAAPSWTPLSGSAGDGREPPRGAAGGFQEAMMTPSTLGRMGVGVFNTFLHVAQPPPTPLRAAARRRARSASR